eukprot:365673-Chlamydomonas_euryale.AAC.5
MAIHMRKGACPHDPREEAQLDKNNCIPPASPLAGTGSADRLLDSTAGGAVGPLPHRQFKPWHHPSKPTAAVRPLLATNHRAARVLASHALTSAYS